MINLFLFVASISALFLSSQFFFGHGLSLVNFPALSYLAFGMTAVLSLIFGVEKVKFLFAGFWGLFNKEKNPPLSDSICGMISYFISVSDKEIKDTQKTHSQDEFLNEAIILFEQNNYGSESLSRLLTNKSENIFRNKIANVNLYRQIAKFPPALGIMATLFGVIAYIAKLSSPLMAISVTDLIEVSLYANLYGFIISNLILIPVAERLELSALNERHKNSLLSNGFFLFSSGVSASTLLEEMNGHLCNGKRIPWEYFKARETKLNQALVS